MRLVRFKYTKTNLLLTKAVVVVLAVGVDYGRAVLSFPNFEVHPFRRLSGSRRVAADEWRNESCVAFL